MKVFFDLACMSACCWGLPKPKYEPFITHNRGTLRLNCIISVTDTVTKFQKGLPNVPHVFHCLKKQIVPPQTHAIGQVNQGHNQAIQDVDEFVSSSDLEKCSSTMDALQWMGAVRMRVQTADKNITIIHTTPVHQLTSWEDKSCVFVRNKSIIKMFLTSNHCFWAKYEFIIHNKASSSENVLLLLSLTSKSSHIFV